MNNERKHKEGEQRSLRLEQDLAGLLKFTAAVQCLLVLPKMTTQYIGAGNSDAVCRSASLL